MWPLAIWNTRQAVAAKPMAPATAKTSAARPGRRPAGDLGQKSGHELGVAVVGLEKCPAERHRQGLGVKNLGILGPGRVGGRDARLAQKGHRGSAMRPQRRSRPTTRAGRRRRSAGLAGRGWSPTARQPCRPCGGSVGGVTVHRSQDGPESPHRVSGVPTFQVMTSSAWGSLSLR